MGFCLGKTFHELRGSLTAALRELKLTPRCSSSAAYFLYLSSFWRIWAGVCCQRPGFDSHVSIAYLVVSQNMLRGNLRLGDMHEPSLISQPPMSPALPHTTLALAGGGIINDAVSSHWHQGTTRDFMAPAIDPIRAAASPFRPSQDVITVPAAQAAGARSRHQKHFRQRQAWPLSAGPSYKWCHLTVQRADDVAAPGDWMPSRACGAEGAQSGTGSG